MKVESRHISTLNPKKYYELNRIYYDINEIWTDKLVIDLFIKLSSHVYSP